MARPLRIQYPGAVYHVTCRGNERKEIYRDNRDRKKFLEILSISISTYRIKLYCYVLMKNHFHLLVETPLGNLGEFMRHFNITYTVYYNRRHRRVGHLHQGRYKSIIVDKERYLSILSRYIHLNPVRVVNRKKRAVKEKIEYLFNYEWSSLPGYIHKRRRENFIDCGMVLEEYGGDNTKGRQAYKKRIYKDIDEGIDIRDKIIGQSIIGGEGFIEWIREKYLKGKKDRESPALRELQSYRAKEEIIEAMEKETGKTFKEIKTSKGSLRQIAMDLLYRVGGFKGVEIGQIFGVDYSTVSQGRKRLREKMQKDLRLNQIINHIEKNLSLLKN